jgi:hypothetical protein
LVFGCLLLRRGGAHQGLFQVQCVRDGHSSSRCDMSSGGGCSHDTMLFKRCLQRAVVTHRQGWRAHGNCNDTHWHVQTLPASVVHAAINAAEQITDKAPTALLCTDHASSNSRFEARTAVDVSVNATAAAASNCASMHTCSNSSLAGHACGILKSCQADL